MNKSDLITTRTPVAEDAAFILSTWLKGLLYGGDALYRKIPKDIYYANHHKVLEKILSSPSTTVKIACLKEDPEVILGYIVYRTFESQSVIDWIFVKKNWRGIGIANSLFPHNVYAVTSLTKAGESIMQKHSKVVFNPYI